MLFSFGEYNKEYETYCVLKPYAHIIKPLFKITLEE